MQLASFGAALAHDTRCRMGKESRLPVRRGVVVVGWIEHAQGWIWYCTQLSHWTRV